MNKTIISAIMLILIAGIASADNPGAIWTTNIDCGNETQDVNHFAVGADVHVNGGNFNPDAYEWFITGKPGGASCDPDIVVASGNITVGENRAFCIHAYTVQIGDCGEYSVDVGKKNDNYRVDVVIEPTTTTTTTSTTTTTVTSTTSTTIPTAPEFGLIGVPLATLLIAPAFAYLVIRRRE